MSSLDLVYGYSQNRRKWRLLMGNLNSALFQDNHIGEGVLFAHRSFGLTLSGPHYPPFNSPDIIIL